MSVADTGFTSKGTSGYRARTRMYWASLTQPLQTGKTAPNCFPSKNLTAFETSGTSYPRSRSSAKRSSSTAVIMALEFIPGNQANPPSPFWQAKIFSWRSPSSREDRRRTYQASERDRTSSPEGSTCFGRASLTMSRILISRRVASEAGTFTKQERSSSSRAFRSVPSRSTAERASVSTCAAGYTGTFTCTASENSEATKDAVRVREPLVIPGLTGNLLVSVAPGFTVTGICCTDSPALRTTTPETGVSAMEDTVTAAS